MSQHSINRVSNPDLIYIKDLLELNSPLQNNMRVSIREHHIDNDDFKKLLKDSKKKNGDNFILSIPIYKVELLFKQVGSFNIKVEFKLSSMLKQNSHPVIHSVTSTSKGTGAEHDHRV